MGTRRSPIAISVPWDLTLTKWFHVFSELNHRRSQKARKVSEMMNRRAFFPFMAALASATQLRGAATPMRTAGVIPLPAPYQSQSATVVELNFAPGERSMAHRHPGFVIGYVVEGTFRFQMEGQPQRILRAGDTFYEPPGATHLIAESASAHRAARVIAIVIADTNKPIVEPA
jgi:quercetin dioxygenase-like cupin family protein